MKIKKYINVLLIIPILIISCQRNHENVNFYNFYYFSDTIYNHIDVKGQLEDGLEFGEFRFSSSNKLLSKGNFNKGLKEGDWLYFLDKEHKVNWCAYTNEMKRLKINYPKKWEILENPQCELLIDTKSDSENKKNKFFVLLKYAVDSINVKPYDYLQDYYLELGEKYSIEDAISYQISSSENYYYYSEFNVVSEGEVMMLLNLVVEYQGNLLDFTYSSSIEDAEIKKVIFFDILGGCFMDNYRIFNPLTPKSSEMLEINKLEK